jgi:hypothetical protein
MTLQNPTGVHCRSHESTLAPRIMANDVKAIDQKMCLAATFLRNFTQRNRFLFFAAFFPKLKAYTHTHTHRSHVSQCLWAIDCVLLTAAYGPNFTNWSTVRFCGNSGNSCLRHVTCTKWWHTERTAAAVSCLVCNDFLSPQVMQGSHFLRNFTLYCGIINAYHLFRCGTASQKSHMLTSRSFRRRFCL